MRLLRLLLLLWRLCRHRRRRQVHPLVVGVVTRAVDHDLFHDLLQRFSIDVHVESHVEHVHHGVELEAVEEKVGAVRGDAAILQVERLEPQIGLESVVQRLGAQIAHALIRVERDASYAEHAVEIGPPVT